MDKFTSEGERLSEQFRSLKDNHKAVLDWWQKQLTEITYAYQGVSHVVNKLIADRQELTKEIQRLREVCEQAEKERLESNVLVGQLQSDLQVFSERLDKIAEWVNKKRGVEK